MTFRAGHTRSLTILGGGPAGMAAAYFAHRRGLDFQVLEAGETVGGNARTLQRGDFLFDTGAHRFHDRNPEITSHIRRLLGDELLHVDAPSQIYSEDGFFDFPLAPYDLLTKLRPADSLRVVGQILKRTLKQAGAADSFREHALNIYGPTLAKRFLLNYSEKLWGVSADELSPAVAGARLKHLDVRSLLIEAVSGKRAKTRHLDGSFFYPKYGIGTIFNAIQETVGKNTIQLRSRVTKLHHVDNYIRSVEINGKTDMPVGHIVNTLPLSLTMHVLDPPPPPELLKLCKELSFRNVQLCVLFLKMPRFTTNASLYFPEAAAPFTRIYEPKNRSAFMAPPDRTAIVVEIPCFSHDVIWRAGAKDVYASVMGYLTERGLLRVEDVFDYAVYKAPYAYPVLHKGNERIVKRLIEYLARFVNVYASGRPALFRYLHIHDLFALGKDVVSRILDNNESHIP